MIKTGIPWCKFDDLLDERKVHTAEKGDKLEVIENVNECCAKKGIVVTVHSVNGAGEIAVSCPVFGTHEMALSFNTKVRFVPKIEDLKFDLLDSIIFNSDRIKKAVDFANNAHSGQERKNGGDYIQHPLSVARIVSLVTQDEDVIIAAILHDTIEDTSTTIQSIAANFGWKVCGYVHDLTDTGVGCCTRAEKKQASRDRLKDSVPNTKTIKLADILDNTKDIEQCDKTWAKMYLEEKLLMLDVLKEGNQVLWNIANEQINGHLERLNND